MGRKPIEDLGDIEYFVYASIGHAIGFQLPQNRVKWRPGTYREILSFQTECYKKKVYDGVTVGQVS